ncbi:M15 family metallopeptidase [Streptomyces sp. 4503]|uniref:D-alanyl-D-alanine dipeptidase n=1 Tax=Streptomyces niphimycinicus TaxID=2842201 RepID=A0ABS6CHE3_9ACTN|nr:M15 family metallopeptidase [Streptomyces niphimycinicus]MBU3866343.1 M15 family metallopeptidase [Streptomyces niphimycinicus]
MPTDRAPAGFVALADVAPTIRQDLRYTGSDNFVGSPLDGYRNATCVLTLPAALALSRAAHVLARDGYALTVLDGYRPQRAVDHMRRWAADPTDQATKARHYPRVAKERLFGPDYIHTRSGHSRGSTVDVTLTTLGGRPLDMGTRFDFFDPRSHTDHPDTPLPARVHRCILGEAMTAAGFRNLPTEWWHFTLLEEPFPDQYFDFLPGHT